MAWSFRQIPQLFPTKAFTDKRGSLPFFQQGKRGLVEFKPFQPPSRKTAETLLQIPAASWLLLLAAHEVLRKKSKQTKRNKANNPNTWTKLFGEVLAALWNPGTWLCVLWDVIWSLPFTTGLHRADLLQLSLPPLCSLFPEQFQSSADTEQREPRAVQRLIQNPPALHAPLASRYNPESRCS